MKTSDLARLMRFLLTWLKFDRQEQYVNEDFHFLYLCSYFTRTALDTNLKIERDWRTSLQEESIKDKEKVAAMQVELKQLETLKKVTVCVIL